MTDYCCFKYRAINKNLIDCLVRSVLYFPTNYQMNDPFDSRIDLSHAIQNSLKSANEEQADALNAFRVQEGDIRRFHDSVSTLGIGSFSLTNQETLMWSHYANDHKGVVLRYDFPYDFLKDEEKILVASRVLYGENPISSWLLDNVHLYRDDHFTFVTELMKKFLTAKAPSWAYEQEARIIRPVSGEFGVPRSLLTHVIFGLQTPEKDEELIRRLLDSYYTDVKIGRATPTGDDFGIDVVEI